MRSAVGPGLAATSARKPGRASAEQLENAKALLASAERAERELAKTKARTRSDGLHDRDPTRKGQPAVGYACESGQGHAGDR